MSEPENREPGTQPPPPPKRDEEPWLPPRMRDKLDEAEREEGGQSPVVGWIVGGVIVLAVIAGGWWFIHSRQVKAEAERAAAHAAAVADSIARVRTADSLLAVARADSIAKFNALPKWKQNQIIAEQARAAGKPIPAGIEVGPFTIDAGEYLFEDKAREEAAAFEASTKLSARVALGSRGAYHIYLGRFDDRDAARRTAAGLVSRALVPQATVVPLK